MSHLRSKNRSYQWQEDYVYGDGRLLASVDAEKGRRSLLLDHLGSVRRVVTPSGVVERSQDFYAFGQEATTPTSGDPALKYTGHERDEIGPSARSLDYMRARYCSPELGRFLSIDPAAESFDPRSGQSWNRYSYVRNSPLKYHDPDGRVLDTIADVGFVIHDLVDIGRTVLKGEKVTTGQKIALAGDLLGAAIPFATGLGKGGKILYAADKGGGAGKALDNLRASGEGAMAGRKLGHTFTKHGSNNTDQLLKEAAGSGKPVGQWLDDGAAEAFIAAHVDELSNGAKTFDLPAGLGRVVNPDGTFSPANKVRLVPSASGVITAYPLLE